MDQVEDNALVSLETRRPYNAKVPKNYAVLPSASGSLHGRLILQSLAYNILQHFAGKGDHKTFHCSISILYMSCKGECSDFIRSIGDCYFIFSGPIKTHSALLQSDTRS